METISLLMAEKRQSLFLFPAKCPRNSILPYVLRNSLLVCLGLVYFSTLVYTYIANGAMGDPLFLGNSIALGALHPPCRTE